MAARRSTGSRAAGAALALLLAALGTRAAAETYLQQLQQQPAAGPAAEQSSKSKPKSKSKSKDKPAEQRALYAPEKVSSEIAPFLDDGLLLADDADALRLLNDVSVRLLAAWPGEKPQLHFYLQSRDAYCAQSYSGGIIVVCTGLLRRAESEAELAAVIGHEISHTLLGHLSSREARSPMPYSFEWAGLALASADSIKQKEKTGKAQVSSKGQDAVMWSFAASTVWGDLINPSWDRGQETDADRLGIDLLRGAGYPSIAFNKMLGQVTNQEGAQSQRLELIRQTAESGLVTKQLGKKGDDASIESVLRTQAILSVSKSLFGGLGKLHSNYASAKERLDAVQAYQAQAYTEREDKSSMADGLRPLKAGAYLKADDLGMQASSLIEGGRRDEARARLKDAERLGQGANAAVIQAKVMHAIDAGKHDEAIQLLQVWTEQDYAPGDAFVALAELEARKQNVDGALASLERGRARVGRAYRFMPHFVRITKRAGFVDAARQFARECHEVAEDEAKGENIFVRSMQSGGGLYASCSAALGADAMDEKMRYRTTRSSSALTYANQQAALKPPDVKAAWKQLVSSDSYQPFGPPRQYIKPAVNIFAAGRGPLRWAGTLDTDHMPLSAEVSLMADAGGTVAGRFKLPTMGCAGVLEQLPGKPEALELLGRLESGKSVCVDGARYRFYLLEDGSAFLQQIVEGKKTKAVAGGVLARG